jgi:D-alanine-D-alanine ligase
MAKNNKVKVALLVGGTSPEREISKLSSQSIYKALTSLGYETVLVDPAYGKNQPQAVDDFFSKKDFTKLSNRNYIEAINSDLFDDVGLAFIGLHGKMGEDGVIQSLLELRGIKYTGSGVLSSAAAMDKNLSKLLFEKFNIKTPGWLSVHNLNYKIDDVLQSVNKSFGFPCVVKPNDQGSTVGLTICKSEDELNSAIKLSLQFSNVSLIEEYIPGRELTVAILENKALPVLEIKPSGGHYDYERKYTPGMSEYEVPAKIPENVFTLVQDQAILAFNSLGCSVYGRVDFRMDKVFNTFCLEVNTLPGMTSTSLVPKMAKSVGISFEDLIEKIIRASL